MKLLVEMTLALAKLASPEQHVIPLYVNLIIVPVKMKPHANLWMGQTVANVPLASLAHCAKPSIAL